MPDSTPDMRVDGKLVTLEIDDAQVKWASEDTHGSAIEWHVLQTKNIIAVIGPSTGSANEYTLLYVVNNVAATEGAKESPFLFNSLIVSGLPQSFVDKYQAKHGVWLDRPTHSKPALAIEIVISAGSGTGLASPVWERLVHPCLNAIGLAPNDYTVHSTTSENSVTELVQQKVLPQANNGGDQLILLLSGDGGIVDIVNALLTGERTPEYKRPTLALLPLGTGNALANSAVVGEDSTMGLRTLVVGSPKELPLFRAIFSPGVRLLFNEGNDEQELHGVRDGRPIAVGTVVCSWGLHASLVADSDTTEYRKFGAERFKMAANEALFPSDGSPPHAYKGRVSILPPGRDEWEDLSRSEHGYILATLVSHLEAGFMISPHGEPLDGKLRLVSFGAISGQEAMEVMKAAYGGGKHIKDDKVRYEEISGLRISFDEGDGRWRRVCVDGKIIRVEKGGWIEVRTEPESVVDLIARSH